MRSRRILILEDDEAFAFYLRSCLNLAREAPEIVFVEKLYDAMEHLETTRFDLVICDIMLPDWSGNPESMLTLISMRAKGAVIAAITGKHIALPTRCCDAAEYKLNLNNQDAVLRFIAEAERNARRAQRVVKPAEALEEWMAQGSPVHASA